MKILIYSLTALLFGSVHAGFSTYIPLEMAKGGILPNGSINLGSQSEVWSATTPTYTAWTIVEMTNCSWFPSAANYEQGQEFMQSGFGCMAQEERYRQEQEISSKTFQTRNVGAPILEQQSRQLPTQNRVAMGTAAPSECEYNVTFNSSESTSVMTSTYFNHYREDGSTVTKIYWQGAEIYNGPLAQSIVSNGYEYRFGSYETNFTYTYMDTYDFYTVCRKPI